VVEHEVRKGAVGNFMYFPGNSKHHYRGMNQLQQNRSMEINMKNELRKIQTNVRNQESIAHARKRLERMEMLMSQNKRRESGYEDNRLSSRESNSGTETERSQHRPSLRELRNENSQQSEATLEEQFKLKGGATDKLNQAVIPRTSLAGRSSKSSISLGSVKSIAIGATDDKLLNSQECKENEQGEHVTPTSNTLSKLQLNASPNGKTTTPLKNIQTTPHQTVIPKYTVGQKVEIRLNDKDWSKPVKAVISKVGDNGTYAVKDRADGAPDADTLVGGKYIRPTERRRLANMDVF